MIKIINGIYGYKQGNSIIPKTKKDEPFECDAKEEARLVQLGVAEYVGESKSAEDAPLYTTDMKLADLKAIALEKGATEEELKPLNTKAKVIELIEKLLADAEQTETEEGAEDAPDLGDVDGVVE